MVQTQGRSGYGIDKRKILTWYGHKEDLEVYYCTHFGIAITLNFILSQHYICIVQSHTSNIYMYIDYCV